MPAEEKEVIIDDVTYRIKKFDPKTAYKWALRMLGMLSDVKDLLSIEDLASKIVGYISSMSDQDYDRLYYDCLSHAFGTSPTGSYRVIDAQGNIVANEIKDKAPQVFQLIVQVFIYTMTDFFTLALSKMNEFVGAASGNQPQEAAPSTSNGFSTPPSSLDFGNTASSGMAPTI
jgi:hypothetical protein